jgi:DNA-binding CsgD family transcriptional regulator
MGARAYGNPRPAVTLGGDDVRRLLRVWSRLHAPATEPAERKRRLILGLCDLHRADAGVAVVTLLDPDTGRPEVLSAVGATANNSSPSPVPWHASTGSEGLLAPPRGGHSLASSLDLQNRPPLMASLTLVRGGPGGAATARAVAALDLVHEEARWLYSADTPLGSPRVRGLPERQRHVLQYRVAGETEADTARWLGVGVRTVRAEAKAAYSRLGVGDREALLARWAAGE